MAKKKCYFLANCITWNLYNTVYDSTSYSNLGYTIFPLYYKIFGLVSRNAYLIAKQP
jgi:hypothetical protein